MPRPNKSRTLAEEENLAQRIAYERTRRKWSYAGLAKRMTDLGCDIQPSALYKIENPAEGVPRRRITVEELVALSKVFFVPIAEMLQPRELWEHVELAARLAELRAAVERLDGARDEVALALGRIANYVAAADDPGLAERVREQWRQIRDAELTLPGFEHDNTMQHLEDVLFQALEEPQIRVAKVTSSPAKRSARNVRAKEAQRGKSRKTQGSR